MNPFSWLMRLFERLFSKDTADYIQKQIGPVVKFIMPFVREFAEASPTKADDEILALYDKYGVARFFDPTKDKSLLLRNLAVMVAQNVGGFNLPTHLIITAVELAYAAYRAGEVAKGS